MHTFVCLMCLLSSWLFVITDTYDLPTNNAYPTRHQQHQSSSYYGGGRGQGGTSGGYGGKTTRKEGGTTTVPYGTGKSSYNGKKYSPTGYNKRDDFGIGGGNKYKNDYYSKPDKSYNKYNPYGVRGGHSGSINPYGPGSNPYTSSWNRNTQGPGYLPKVWSPNPFFSQQPPVFNVVPEAIYETKKSYRRGVCFDVPLDAAYSDESCLCDGTLPTFFTYSGGCYEVFAGCTADSTLNKFASPTDCQRSCEPKCDDFFHPYDCSLFQSLNTTAIGHSWNTVTSSCEETVYHPGCPGLGQLFDSKQNCDIACRETSL